MAYTHSAVVSWPLGIPGVHESTRAEREAVAAVGVADLQNRACHAIALGHEQFKVCVSVFRNGEQRDRTVLHAHFDREALSHLAVVDLEWSHLCFPLTDGDVPWAVMTHQNQIFVKVDRIVLGE